MLVLARLGRFTVAHRKSVLAGTALFFVLAVTLGGGVADKLTTGGFADPNSESEPRRRIRSSTSSARSIPISCCS